MALLLLCRFKRVPMKAGTRRQCIFVGDFFFISINIKRHWTVALWTTSSMKFYFDLGIWHWTIMRLLDSKWIFQIRWNFQLFSTGFVSKLTHSKYEFWNRKHVVRGKTIKMTARLKSDKEELHHLTKKTIMYLVSSSFQLITWHRSGLLKIFFRTSFKNLLSSLILFWLARGRPLRLIYVSSTLG